MSLGLLPRVSTPRPCKSYEKSQTKRLPGYISARNYTLFHVIIGSWPFSFPAESRPSSSLAGMSFFDSRAVFSAQDRSLTRLRIAASRLWFCVTRIALFTRSATVLRKSGCRISASCGSRLEVGKTSKAIVLSRSSRNAGFCGARGANCSVANVNAGVISPPGDALHDRINSTSCSLSSAKCNAGLLSSIYYHRQHCTTSSSKIA